LTFVSYQDELKQIWRDNIAATKSAVLTDEVEEKNVSDSVLVCVRNQSIIKVREWKNSSYSSKRRSKTGDA
jgi:hypothetical protein